ncbi:MAG: siroheme synthase, partial [Lacrimispora sp.]|nr:siroheme synthase [Lacrimispora sp.]
IAQYLKKRFKEAIPSGFGMLASQLGNYRELVKEKVPSLTVRTEIFKTMVKEGIRQGGVFTREQVIELIERKLAEHEQ